MDLNKKPTLVLFLDRNRFSLYSEVQNKVYNFDLSPFTSNLEIINKTGLQEQINNLITTSQIPPGNIISVLSENLLFIKAIPQNMKLEQEEEEIQKFTDSVPFEHVLVKPYTVEGGKLLVGTNKDYYQDIKNCFEKSGFGTTIITPVYSAGIAVDTTQGLDENAARFMLKNIDSLQVGGLEKIEVKKINNVPQPSTTAPRKSGKKRLITLTGVFAVLIVLLVVVLISSNNNNIKPSIPVKTAGNAAPTIHKELQSSSSAQLNIQNTKIMISSLEIAASSSASLKSTLENSGFKFIAQKTDNVGSNIPLIIFNPDVDPPLRTQITNNVSQVAGNFTVREAVNPEADVLIYLVD